MMRSRRGMTLLELMVALVVGSVVVLLAWATLRGGLDAQDRVAAARDDAGAMSVLRTLVGDALRHAVVSDDRGTPVGLRVGTAPTGPALEFLTRGIDAPLGATAIWRVRLVADSAGVRLAAQSTAGDRLPLQLRLPGVWTVAVRARTVVDAEWRGAWADSTRLPQAVEVRFLDRNDREIGAPLIARPLAAAGGA